ncbi:MAG: VCBS repeat-containing protein [Planctomycetota bacterium]
MHRPFSHTRLTAGCCVLFAAAFTTSAFGQQYVEDTALRFPSPVNLFSNQMSIGDIDNDGDLDIIFANGGNFSTPGPNQTQQVLINLNNVRFVDQSNRLNFAGLCRGVEMGDIDNDGDLDVLFAQDFNRLPQLFLNDGTGFFTNITTTNLPNITLSSSRGQFGDIDNDGDLDIYITSGAGSRFSCGQYRIYVNDGTGVFTDETNTRHPIGNVCNNMDCIFGDIDNDFDLDVRTASTGTNNSRLYRNDGTGVYTQAAIPSDSSCYSYDFGDIDGDGDLDLLGANGGSGNSDILYRNNGSGTFTNISANISPNPSLDDNDSKFIDYDNDGDLDLLIARLGSGGERMYQNDGTGNFTQVFGVVEVVTDSSLDVGVADLIGGDGIYDIVTANGESGIYTNRIYVGNGPADTNAPTIVDTEELPSECNTDGPYVVRALILDDITSDRNFFDKGIFLNYSVNAGPVQQVAMRHSGGQVYRGEIPGQPAGANVDYFVTAIDWNDNEGTGATKSFVVDCPIMCPWDCSPDNGDGTFGNGAVNIDDLLAVINSFDDLGGPCDNSPDNGDGTFGNNIVNIDDLLGVINNFGDCP